MVEQRLAAVNTNRSTNRLEMPAAEVAAKARRVLAIGSNAKNKPTEVVVPASLWAASRERKATVGGQVPESTQTEGNDVCAHRPEWTVKESEQQSKADRADEPHTREMHELPSRARLRSRRSASDDLTAAVPPWRRAARTSSWRCLSGRPWRSSRCPRWNQGRRPSRRQLRGSASRCVLPARAARCRRTIRCLRRVGPTRAQPRPA